MRMTDAAEIVALDVFEAAQAAGEPVTLALVKRRVDELLAHPPEYRPAGAVRPPRWPESGISGAWPRRGSGQRPARGAELLGAIDAALH